MNTKTDPAAAAEHLMGASPLLGRRVYRLGADIILDSLVSWCPPGVRDTQPLNCYLIKGEYGSILVDTGVRLHEAKIIAQLEALLDPGEPVAVVLTRTEMECCLNLPAIESRFNVESVWFTGGITVPRATAELRRIAVEPGASLDAEVLPGETLQFISPLMRLLPTLWIYDPPSGVLLTSDAFTHRRRSDSNPDDGLRKFRWFAEAHTSAIADDVERIVRERRVTAVGPCYGQPIIGEAECMAEAAALAAAIRKAGAK